MVQNQDAWDVEYRRKGVLWRGEAELPNGLGGRVLELGCGDGKSMVPAQGRDMVGIDISIEGLRLCAARLQDAHSLVQADATFLPFRDEAFDALLAFHLLENLGDDEVRALALEAARVLRPDGVLYVRSFHPEDMRSPGQGGKAERSGIVYHYRDEAVISALLHPLRTASMQRVELRKRYHGRERLRVVVHAEFRNRPDV